LVKIYSNVRSSVKIEIHSRRGVNGRGQAGGGFNRPCAANELTPTRPHGFVQLSVVLLSRPLRRNLRLNGHGVQISWRKVVYRSRDEPLRSRGSASPPIHRTLTSYCQRTRRSVV
jgi:hypothetical protein